MKLENIHKKSTDKRKRVITSEICGYLYFLNTFSANAIKEWCGNTADEADYFKCCNEQIRHDGEALALLEFVAIGEQSISDSPESLEGVEAFLLEI